MTTDTTPKDADRAALAEEAKRMASGMRSHAYEFGAGHASAASEMYACHRKLDAIIDALAQTTAEESLSEVCDRLASLPSQPPPAVLPLAARVALVADGLADAAAAAHLPASDADIAEHMRLVVEYAGLHFIATRTGERAGAKEAREAVEASARRLTGR